MSQLAFARPEYDEDFVVWAEHQIILMRERQFAQLDIDNLLDELEFIVSSRRNAMKGRLRVLILHLLKCEYQPEKRSASWVSTIVTQRREIEELIEESPSFRRLLVASADLQFRKAVNDAVLETNLPRTAFPSTLPYSPEQLLDHHFIP